MKYTKRSVTIEAFRWTGGPDQEEDPEWIAEAIKSGTVRIPMITNDAQIPVMEIDTLEGTMIASVGDFIIKGIKGEIYPCKPDIFEQTYLAGDAKQMTEQEAMNVLGLEKGWNEPRPDEGPKDLGITEIRAAKDNIKDIEVYGDGDTFHLLCKASSQSQGWMKSTKVANVPNGCLVQVTTQQRNPDGSYAVAEALTFAPQCRIDLNQEPRKIVKA